MTAAVLSTDTEVSASVQLMLPVGYSEVWCCVTRLKDPIDKGFNKISSEIC